MAEVKTVPMVFAAAGEQSAAVAGEFVHVVDATGPVFIQLDHLGAWLELEKALGVRVQGGFSGVRVRSDIPQSVRLMIGVGEVIDARTILSSGAVVQVAGGDSVGYGAVAVGDVAVQVLPQNIARVSAMVWVEYGPVFFGSDNLVTPVNGFRVDSGESITISAKAAIWAVSMTPGNGVRYLEELN